MAIDSKNLLVWVKAMSRGQALPLDASEVHESFSAAQSYAETAIAYPGQSVKALMEDGKYHEFILQPSDSGYTLEEVGAIKESDLVQYVRVVEELPTSGQEEGIIYIVNFTNPDGETIEGKIYDNDGGYIWTGTDWSQIFYDPQIVNDKFSAVNVDLGEIEDALDDKAPIANPVFTGTVKIGSDEVAVKSYVDGLMANLVSDVPGVLGSVSIGSTAYGISRDDVHDYKAGETYRIVDSDTYFGLACEPGDLVIMLTDYSGEAADGYNADNPVAMVIQANIDGAVTSSTATATVGEIVVFDAVTGKVIKGSGIQIASLETAISKAHEHSNKAILDSYNKNQTELLAAAKSEAQGLVTAHETAVNTALDGKADKATTLAGYGIGDAYTKTEIDNKVQTLTDNLNTKASSADVAQNIAAAKSETLEEAATAAEEFVNSRLGSAIGADTTVAQYIDTAVGAGGTASATAIATAKQEAIDTSKSYTDTKISEALAVVNF